MITLFLALVFWHALADFPLQGDYLAKAKNRWSQMHTTYESSGVYPLKHSPWWWHMSMHAMIHAAGVAFFTGSMLCGFLEFALHWGIDTFKIDGKISSFQDQLLHIACKAGYVLGLWWLA